MRKGVVEQVFAALELEPRFERAPPRARARRSPPPCSRRLGRELDPGVGLEGEWSAFELDLAELFAHVPERVLYRDVITYPSLLQDLAFVVDEEVPAGELIAAAREAAGDELREARFLRDYRGDQVAAGKKSIAFSVTFQSAERHALGRGRGPSPGRDVSEDAVRASARSCRA